MNFLSTLGTRFRTADPHHAAIFKGMLTVAVFTLLGKLISAGKEMAVAFRYGLSAEVDAYQFLYSLVSWPIGIWCSVLTAVLVPLAGRMRDADKGAIPRFRSELLGFGLLIGTVLALLAWPTIHVVLASGRSGLPENTALFAEAALPGVILLLPFGMLVSLQSAWMLSAGRHINTLLDSIPTLFIAGAILFFPGGGIDPLVWGTVVGFVFHLLALLIPMARRNEFESPAFALASPVWRWFWQGFGIMIGGQALMSFTVIVDQFYAVSLGTGSVATLGYANRVLSLILGLAAIAVSRATLPIFSTAAPEWSAKIHSVAAYWARLMFVAGIAVMLLSYMAAPWVIKLLFERGQFSAADTAIVVDVFRFGLPQLPFYFSCMVLVSYALSQHRYKLIFYSGVIGCVAKLAGNLLLVPPLGVNGIALGTIFVYGFNTLFFSICLWRSK
ncbi:murein biosynthesis integral membrane protein MurJ [Massilia sp. S19_KUP03_FR1]|uniref:murein biosynthesis integral membrane protein MurJ n=1 Tax=Massilia sp. S19_KUP03_FR1 TaxID=3025503 RepID=UPI002FCDE177